MALVTDDVVLQTRRRLVAMLGEEWDDKEIDLFANLPSALAMLARKVLEDDARRHLLQQDYTVTLSSGVGNLLTATGSLTSAADMIVDGVYWGVVKDADENILYPIKHYHSFLRPQPLVYDYYCLKGERIHTRSKTQQVSVPSDVTSVTSPLTITANFEPKVCTVVPDELQDDLIQCLIDAVVGKLPAKK